MRQIQVNKILIEINTKNLLYSRFCLYLYSTINQTKMAITTKPKFNIGDVVVMKKPTLYGETFGTISEGPAKCFKSESGLVTEERTIKSIQLPYEFDGEILVVHYPEHDYGTWIEKAHSSTSVFCFYSYTVKTPKILTVYRESSLRLK